MKTFIANIVLFCVLFPLQAQISHGGMPLFFPENGSSPSSSSGNLKYAMPDFFIEMPAFDVNEMLEEDAFNVSNMKGAFRFAKKFFVSIEKGKSGRNYTLPDGTKVWQAGIRSRGAYSINVLFSEFHIPEGGKLFLYNSDHSHILGSFTHENNSENNLLPISPVKGEEIIVEYSEPADASFEGILKITEVNHDYRGILRAEPVNDPKSTNPPYPHDCMPDILCTTSPMSKEKDAVVLLIVNGNSACSGSIVNNAKNDGTPYLLTAMHCLNLEDPLTTKTQDYYQQRAGTIVAFFNYNRPVCDTRMRGVEEMSIAGAVPRCVIEAKDLALLELKDTIPDYYQAYYAGWNASPNIGSPPYTNIHHPLASMKKFGETSLNITMNSYAGGAAIFEPNSFWTVSRWTVGSTNGGSSGSPLFDANNRIIGGLTGGLSECSGNNPNGASDQFSSLNKGWEYSSSNYFLQLKHWLDPDGTGALTCPGFDPLAANPFEKKSNIDFSAIDSLENTKVSSGTGLLFGHSSLNINKFAEEFYCEQKKDLYGVYLLNPSFYNNGRVEIQVYSAGNDGKPGEKTNSIVYRPQYADYWEGDFENENKNTRTDGMESFVKFPQEITVEGTFFIGYEIIYPASPVSYPFSVYNAFSRQTTAWVNHPALGWIKSSEIPEQSKPASLAVQALLRNHRDSYNSVEKIRPAVNRVYYSREAHKIKVDCEPNESGVVRLYSISGKLIGQYSHQGPAEFPAPSVMENAVGILQWRSEKHVETVKAVFYK